MFFSPRSQQKKLPSTGALPVHPRDPPDRTWPWPAKAPRPVVAARGRSSPSCMEASACPKRCPQSAGEWGGARLAYVLFSLFVRSDNELPACSERGLDDGCVFCVLEDGWPGNRAVVISAQHLGWKDTVYERFNQKLPPNTAPLGQRLVVCSLPAANTWCLGILGPLVPAKGANGA